FSAPCSLRRVGLAATRTLALALAADLLADELLHARLLADAIAEVVELRAAHVAAASDLDVLHAGAVHGEDPLDALAGDDAPNGDRLAEAAALVGDHGAREDLDALLVAFLDEVVDVDGVAHVQHRQVLFAALRFQCLDQFHRSSGSLVGLCIR